MAYIYESDVGRLGGNLQTTVAYLLSLHKAEYEWNLLGIKVVGHVDALPIPDGNYEYGDAYTVGTAAPYDMWIYTRADAFHSEAYWFNIGKFPAPGPQGPKGDGLEQINKWTNGTVGNVTYDTTDGAKVKQTSTVNYTDSTDGSTKQQQFDTTTTLPIIPGKYISMNATSDNKKMEVKVDDTELALDYIKIDKTIMNYVPWLTNGTINPIAASQNPDPGSLVFRGPGGHISSQACYTNLLVGWNNTWQQADMNEVYRTCRTSGTDQIIEKTPTDTGTMSADLLAVFQGTPNSHIIYDNKAYYRMGPTNAPDGTLNFIHIDSIEDGNGGYKATGKCFSITISTREWQVVDLKFGSGIYQHLVNFTLNGANSWYITLVLTTSSDQAITRTTLYKYLTNVDSPLIGGVPVDCYRSAVDNPIGFGNGRMSATYNADTRTATYYFALSNENIQETVSTPTASISGFIDTVTEV